jgi:hypothetical protein
MKKIILTLLTLLSALFLLNSCEKSKNNDIKPATNYTAAQLDSIHNAKYPYIWENHPHTLQIIYNDGFKYVFAGRFAYIKNGDTIYKLVDNLTSPNPNVTYSNLKKNDSFSITLSGWTVIGDTTEPIYTNGYSKVVIKYNNKIVAADSGGRPIRLSYKITE